MMYKLFSFWFLWQTHSVDMSHHQVLLKNHHKKHISPTTLLAFFLSFKQQSIVLDIDRFAIVKTKRQKTFYTTTGVELLCDNYFQEGKLWLIPLISFVFWDDPRCFVNHILIILRYNLLLTIAFEVFDLAMKCKVYY